MLRSMYISRRVWRKLVALRINEGLKTFSDVVDLVIVDYERVHGPIKVHEDLRDQAEYELRHNR